MSKLVMKYVESKNGTSFANENESLMLYSFDVRNANTGTRNLLDCIVVDLLLEEWVKEKRSDQWMVYVP